MAKEAHTCREVSVKAIVGGRKLSTYRSKSSMSGGINDPRGDRQRDDIVDGRP